MKRILCPRLPSPGRPVKLDENEASHATRVMRLRDGSPIVAMDGSGRSVQATLKLLHGVPHLEFAHEIAAREAEVVPVTLELAVLKGDAMEWAVEKAVELGIESLVPVLTERTIVRMDRKGPEAFQERWQKIADQALKQCGRSQRMEVLPPRELGSLFTEAGPGESRRFWLDEAGEGVPTLNEALSAAGSAAVHLLVGPEGGWGESERSFLGREAEQGRCTRVTMGPLILRAETAALASCALAAAQARSGARSG